MTDNGLPKIDTQKPPLCPACHHPVFRAGQMATFFDTLAKEKGAFTVCMWCSTIWKLTGSAEALSFKAVPPEDAAAILRDAARVFAKQRAMAQAIGVPYERFVDQIAPLAKAAGERFGVEKPRPN